MARTELSSRKAMAALIALAALGLALVALGWAGNPQVALMGIDGAREKAQADQSMFSVVFGRAKEEKQAAALQRKLAAKDIRLSESLAKAARAQAMQGADAEQKVAADVRRKTILVGSVHKLSSVLGAEEHELRQATVHLDNDSKNEQALRRALPQLHLAQEDIQRKLARVNRGEQRAEKGMKTQVAEEKKAKQVLRQSMRAYNNYGVRAESAKEKQRLALSKTGLLKAKALVAERKARLDQTSALSDAVKFPAKARQLRTAASNDEAAASLLRAQADESAKNAQLWGAKADEAQSYMKMMKADVQAAEQRVLRKESMQRRGAQLRLARRQLEEELREADREERKGDIAQARLLHDAVENKGIVAIGIKDVRRTRHGLAQALRGVEQAQQGAMLASKAEVEYRQRVQVDEAQAQALRFAAAEHTVASSHLSAGEKAAAAEAKGLMERAKSLLSYAAAGKQAARDDANMRRLDQTAEALQHRALVRE